jgi:hypothetical protein
MDEVQAMNGTAPAMTQVTDVLRDAIAVRSARYEELAAELAQVKRELANYQKALELIDGTPRVKPGPKAKAAAGTKIGPERLAVIEDSIRDYVNQHGDVEFRQMDIREHMGNGGNGITSGVSSFAFKSLRDNDVIRLARKDGNNLYYRLTRKALAQ